MDRTGVAGAGVRSRWMTVLAGAAVAALMVPGPSAMAAAFGGVSTAAGTGSIGGTVTGLGGVPIEGLQVWVQTTAGANATYAMTGPDGTYLVGPVPDDDYEIQLIFAPPSPVYPSGYYDANAPGHFSMTSTDATPVTVTGADVAGIDVELPEARRVRGTIMGADLSTVADAYLSVCRLPAGTTCAAAVTAPDGTFTSELVLDGDYRLGVSAPDPYFSGWYAAGAPGSYVADVASAGSVTVSGADVTGLSMTLPVGHTLSGTVTAADAGPLDGVAISACPAPPSGPCADTSTAADGTYVTPILGDADYTVHLAPPSPYLAGWYAAGPTPNFSADAAGAGSVTVAGADVASIDVTVPVAPPPPLGAPPTPSPTPSPTPVPGPFLPAPHPYAELEPTLPPLPPSLVLAPAPMSAPVPAPLGAPASAVAPSVPAPSSIRIHTSIGGRTGGPRTLTRHARAIVVVTAITDRAMAGRLLHVWVRRGAGPWRDLYVRRVDAHGVARFTLTAQDEIGVRFQWRGDATVRPAWGDVVRIRAIGR